VKCDTFVQTIFGGGLLLNTKVCISDTESTTNVTSLLVNDKLSYYVLIMKDMNHVLYQGYIYI